jgi:hypothetical protein
VQKRRHRTAQLRTDREGENRSASAVVTDNSYRAAFDKMHLAYRRPPTYQSGTGSNISSGAHRREEIDLVTKRRIVRFMSLATAVG